MSGPIMLVVKETLNQWSCTLAVLVLISTAKIGPVCSHDVRNFDIICESRRGKKILR